MSKPMTTLLPPTPDTLLLRSLIADWHRVGGELRLPNRHLRINQTIEINQAIDVNGRITCESPADEIFAGNLVNQMGSAIIWTGEPGIPMIRIRSMNLIWDGPALWALGNRPSAAIEICKTRGIGTGRVHFRQLHVAGCEAAIKTSHVESQGNCDQLQVDRFCIRDCDFGYWSTSAQNTGNYFGYVTAHSIHKAVFRFEHLTTTQCRMLMVNNSVKCVLSFGRSAGQAGSFLLDGMKVDPASPNTILVDNDRWSSFAMVTMRNCVGNGDHVFNLMGEVLLVLDGCMNIVRKDCIQGRALSHLQAKVSVTNCRIDPEIKSGNDVVSESQWFGCRLVNCTSEKDGVWYDEVE